MKNLHIKVFDCTIRDGGLMNNWYFPHETVRQLFIANTRAKVDYMEMGYRASTDLFSPAEYGPWKFCNEEDLKSVVEGIETDVKLSMMVDIGRCHKKDILPRELSVIRTIRIACYVHQADETIEMAHHCLDMGYECFINIMAVSTAEMTVIKDFLYRIEEETTVKGVYVSDTFGSFTIHRVPQLVRLYKDICKSKVIGFHGHNNQQLALANTLLAMNAGAQYLDGTCFGMGRGAGNCPLELLLSQLGRNGYNFEAILPVIERYIEPLMPEFRWGYRIPYALTGITNQHPRSGMSFMNDNDSGYDVFYTSLLNGN